MEGNVLKGYKSRWEGESAFRRIEKVTVVIITVTIITIIPRTHYENNEESYVLEGNKRESRWEGEEAFKRVERERKEKKSPDRHRRQSSLSSLDNITKW